MQSLAEEGILKRLQGLSFHQKERVETKNTLRLGTNGLDIVLKLCSKLFLHFLADIFEQGYN